MVECQWDSVVLSPYSPVLTGLGLTFMCLTRSNSSLFSTPGFVVSPSDLSMSSNFGLWSSYMLEYCWLFALLLRSARYLPGAEGKWIPLPPMLSPSSSPTSWFVFKTLSTRLSISWWMIYECPCPHHTECSAVFDQKMAWPPCPSLPIRPISPWAAFLLFPLVKNSSKGNVLPMWKRWNKKNSRSIKRHQNRQVQKLFWAVEKMSQ